MTNNAMYLLIDAAQYPGIWRVLQYRFRRLPWLSLYEDTSDADAVQTGPVLVQVGTNQTKTLAWFLEHTKDIHCLSWITSPLSLITLRGHLSSLMLVQADDGTECVMRYYDTRVLPAWVAMLDYQQKRHVLGPVTSWSFINRDGMANTFAGNGHAVAPEPCLLQLTPAQEMALLNAALPDAIIKELKNAGNVDLLAMQDYLHHPFITEQIAKGRELYAIDTFSEMLSFCTLALALGEEFDQLHPLGEVLNPDSAAYEAYLQNGVQDDKQQRRTQ